MKYFTPELWLRMQAGVDRATFAAAYADWERAVEAYERSLDETIPDGKGYSGVRKFAKGESLHDAAVLGCWYQSAKRLLLLVKPGEPDAELGLLSYTLERQPMRIGDRLPGRFRTEAPRWMYDEIGRPDDATDEYPFFTHNILLSDGTELVIYFTRLVWTRHHAIPVGRMTWASETASQIA